MIFLLLNGCASQPLPSSITRLPERVELSGVPFFAYSAHQGAPAALAIALTQQGVVTTPGLIAKQLQLPEQLTQLEPHLQATVQAHGLLVYPLTGGLPELLTQVSAGYPVLLRYGQSSGWMGASHYAVLVGYDQAKQTLVLRSGMHRRAAISFADFESAWREGGRWAVLVQAPAQLPAQVDRARWLKAATELEKSGQALAASNAYRAIEQPPAATKSLP